MQELCMSVQAVRALLISAVAVNFWDEQYRKVPKKSCSRLRYSADLSNGCNTIVVKPAKARVGKGLRWHGNRLSQDSVPEFGNEFESCIAKWSC